MANILIVAANPQHHDRLVDAVAASGAHAVIGDTLTTNAYPYIRSRGHKQPELIVVDTALGDVTSGELADHWHQIPTILVDAATSDDLHLGDVITLALRFT